MRQSGGAPFSFDHRQMGPYVELLLAARRVVVADREEFHKKVDLRQLRTVQEMFFICFCSQNCIVNQIDHG